MRKSMKMEVLPSPFELAQTPMLKAQIQEMAVKMAAEIIADREQFTFEPFFRTRSVAYELRRLQTVTEQRKWTVYFERHGCLICETMDRPHAGNGMCNRCRSCTFQRLRQIEGEQVRNQEARPARGRLRLDRMLPPGKSPDGIHHRRYEVPTAQEKELFNRVASRLQFTYQYVREVARGRRMSETVQNALLQEAAKMEDPKPKKD